MASLDFDLEESQFRSWYAAQAVALEDACAALTARVAAVVTLAGGVDITKVEGRVKDVEELRELNRVIVRLGEKLGLRRVVGEIQLPTDAGRLRARLHALDAVQHEEHDADGWRLRVDLPAVDAARLAAQADGAPLRPLLPVIETELPVERFPVESDA